MVLLALTIALFGAWFFVSQEINFKDILSFRPEKSDAIKVTGLKNVYSEGENIINSGVAKNNSEIILFSGDKIGMIKADTNGKWIVNFGKMNEGKYGVQMLSKDSKTSNSTVSFQITVKKNVKTPNFLTAGLSSIMPEQVPDPLVTIPKESPAVLQKKWGSIK